MYWPDEDPEPTRLAVLALLIGYDRQAGHLAGAAMTVDQRPYSRSDAALVASASRLERHIARQLGWAIEPADLYQILRLGVGSPGEERFMATVIALTKPSIPYSPHEIGLDGIDRLRARQSAGVCAAYRTEILPALTGADQADAEAALARIEAAAAAGPRPVRIEVVTLLLSRDPRPGPDRHADGRPFTEAERLLVRTATDKEWNEALNIKHADVVIEASRQGRHTRLRQILESAPFAVRRGFDADLDHQLSCEPDPDDAPLVDLVSFQEERDAAFIAAFRRHILPRLSPELRAEARALIEELDPLSDP